MVDEHNGDLRALFVAVGEIKQQLKDSAIVSVRAEKELIRWRESMEERTRTIENTLIVHSTSIKQWAAAISAAVAFAFLIIKEAVLGLINTRH